MRHSPRGRYYCTGMTGRLPGPVKRAYDARFGRVVGIPGRPATAPALPRNDWNKIVRRREQVLPAQYTENVELSTKGR